MKRIEIMPLGGIGEFGMNSMAIRFNGEMILVDAGMGFPEESAYGVDIAIPDYACLEEYGDEITALILTHAHEDHIGAAPYFLKEFNVPVYASPLTMAFLEEKLSEHGIIEGISLNRVDASDIADIGSFEVEFIHASHSLVECFSLAITTPVGTLIHTGDYKIDDTPVIGRPYDLETLSRYGKRGVLALLADSTNSTVPGRTPSEQDVIPDFEEIFEEAEGRIFVTTFSSSLHRLQIVFDIAHEFGRKVCVLGRSMRRNIEIGERLGLLNIPPDTEISLDDSINTPQSEIAYLVTGSQGEQRAVMWNLSTQSYKGLSIQEGDTIVLSARIIPGNEKRISKMIGAIYRRGGNIIEEKRRLIHVSGHASQEDIRIMTETANPKFVIPIHGEYRMLFRHKEFLKNHLGFADENVILIENGDVLELDEDSALVVDQKEVGRTFIDGLGLNEIELETVRERKKLAFNGIVSIFIGLDPKTRELKTGPIVEIKGVAGIDRANGMIEDLRETVIEALYDARNEKVNDLDAVVENLRIKATRFLKKEIGSKPLVVPTVIED